MKEIIEKIIKRYKDAVEKAEYYKLKTDAAVDEYADDDAEMYSEMAGVQIDRAYAFYEILANDLSVDYSYLVKTKTEAEQAGKDKYYQEE